MRDNNGNAVGAIEFVGRPHEDLIAHINDKGKGTRFKMTVSYLEVVPESWIPDL